MGFSVSGTMCQSLGLGVLALSLAFSLGLNSNRGLSFDLSLTLTLNLFFYPPQFDLHHIRAVHAFELHHVRPAPFHGETAAELEHEDVGKGVMVEKATHPGRVMPAELKLLPHFVPGVAMTLYALDGP
jgi:hypothetical protein